MAESILERPSRERVFFLFRAELLKRKGDILVFRTLDKFPAVIMVPARYVRTVEGDFLLMEGAEVRTMSGPAGVRGEPERDDACPDGRTQCAGGVKFCCGRVAIGTCQGTWSCEDS